MKRRTKARLTNWPPSSCDASRERGSAARSRAPGVWPASGRSDHNLDDHLALLTYDLRNGYAIQERRLIPPPRNHAHQRLGQRLVVGLEYPRGVRNRPAI